MNKNKRKDQIMGCLLGVAAGDALGYAIEFDDEKEIYARFGGGGIRSYEKDRFTGKAVVSDDTQMTLFTAEGLLAARAAGEEDKQIRYIAKSYQDWYLTQCLTGPEAYKGIRTPLMSEKALYVRRAPGMTCLEALGRHYPATDDYIGRKINGSKGCGGIMRVAPIGLVPAEDIRKAAMLGAQAAAVTHSQSLGYMTAAVLVYILQRIVFTENGEAPELKSVIMEAERAVSEMFAGDKHLAELRKVMEKAVLLAGNDSDDLTNIHKIGEGWVAEETLGIALYCALRYEKDFTGGLIASVNHKGDSDSTGAVTGSILGALTGEKAIDSRWKKDLELADVIRTMGEQLADMDEMNAR